MTDLSRIEDLRRRVHADPASIAFAQLAEECRRAGQLSEAIDVCRQGLARHPGYLSARVTLGRALLQLGQLDTAQAELEHVRRLEPNNLPSLRTLGELHRTRGELQDALTCYRLALGMAPNDPELDRAVADLASHVSGEAHQNPKSHLGDPACIVARELDHPGPPVSPLLSVLEQWLSAIHVARAQRSP